MRSATAGSATSAQPMREPAWPAEQGMLRSETVYKPPRDGLGCVHSVGTTLHAACWQRLHVRPASPSVMPCQHWALATLTLHMGAAFTSLIGFGYKHAAQHAGLACPRHQREEHCLQCMPEGVRHL